jgi:hypothetical protein
MLLLILIFLDLIKKKKKESLPNRKSIGQKEVNNKIHTACSDQYHKSFPNFDSPENLPQHI